MVRRKYPPTDNSIRPSPSNNQRQEASEIRRKGEVTNEGEIVTDSSDSESESSRKPIRIVVESTISSIALFADGEHKFATGDGNGKIRCWRVEDGEQTRRQMDAKSAVRCVSASQDGKRIAAGTECAGVFMWDAESGNELTWFETEKAPNSVDISSDGSKIAIAWDNKSVEVFSLQEPKHLWGWVNCDFHTVKFSPNGLLLAYTITYSDEDEISSSIEIRNSQDGDYDGGIEISTRSVVWTSDGKQLFALSSDGDIHCVDVSSEKTLSQWAIHSASNPTCISLSSNGTFIAASANSSISFWDTLTHEQIGFVIHHPYSISSMAISQNYDLIFTGKSTIALWDLRDVLFTPYIDNQSATSVRRTESSIDATINEFCNQLTISHHVTKQKEDDLQNTIKLLRADLAVQKTKSMDLEKTVKKCHRKLAKYHQGIRVHRKKHQCETLYANGHVIDAAKPLLDITRSITDNIKSDTIIMDWLSVFTVKCVAALGQIGDKASQSRNDGEALAAYGAALALSPSGPNAFLCRWVSTMLLHGSTREILEGARKLKLEKLAVYRAICDVLEGDGRVTEAIGCLREMHGELTQVEDVGNEQAKWDLDFQQRCTERLEKTADAAFSSQNYDEADRHYSTILSLNQPDRAHTLIKRSNTRAMMKSWGDALMDADEVIKLDPSSYRGYECRHAALHGASRHTEAISAFDTMLLKLQESSNARVRVLRSQYRDARRDIKSIVQATTSQMPRVLIDTTTGRLCDRTQQAETFETLPIFNELVSSMTREIDAAWIRKEVTEFCKYVMFSHKWEHGEPLFQSVVDLTVYKLQASRGNIKLQTFCSIVRALGFRWAWSDTCCIDKSDNVVLQESLVAMFTWYRGASLTIIHLLGVSSLSEVLNALRESIWNSRVWTYQEYVAAKRVLFYTEDWKPYLGLTLENHKESPLILKEMEMSEVSSEQVAVLQPGLDRIREKLYLASTRETTLVEDSAYSLLGILDASIPIIYGEGTRAVGRLLEFVLTGSGDATILAWTGTANKYNSCLPLNLTVYNPLVPPHIPRMETADLDSAVTELRTSLPDVSLATTLYHELNKLPAPTVISSRLRLPGIVSPITDVSMSGQTYHATTDLFGDIEVETASSLGTMNKLCVVHPWIHPLLDQEFARGSARLDLTTQSLRLVARLRQPFGALLFKQVSRTEYKRVAADSLIMVQIRKEVSLTDLMSNIRTIEVL